MNYLRLWMKFPKNSVYNKNETTMKKSLLLSLALFGFAIAIFAQNPTNIIPDALQRSAEAKVQEMQQLIRFDDNQAEQLKTMQFQFLLNVRRAENRTFRSRRNIERLQRERDAALQQILTREQYIRWNAVENNIIQNIPVRVTPSN